MKKFQQIVFILLCAVQFLNAQLIDGTVLKFSNEVIFFKYYTLDNNFKPIQKLTVDKNNNLQFVSDQPSGLYGLGYQNEPKKPVLTFYYEKHTELDFVFDKANPQNIVMKGNNLNEQIQKTKNENEGIAKKHSMLLSLLDNYPADQPFYGAVQKEYQKILEENKMLQKNNLKRQGNQCYKDFLRTCYNGFYDLDLKKEQRINYLKSHLLDSIDFSSDFLQNTRLLNEKLKQYMSLYAFESGGMDTVNKYMKPAIDNIINQALNGRFAKDDKAKQKKAINYLSSNLSKQFDFKQWGYLNEYLASIIPDDLFSLQNTNCTAEEEAGLKSIQVYKSLFLGKKAPAFSFTKNNKLYSFDTIEKDKIVLFFWSSTCMYCKEAMIELEKLYRAPYLDKFEIISIQTDQGKIDNSFKWLNLESSQTVIDAIKSLYGITKTPTFFILDKERNIEFKPDNIQELKSNLYQD